MKTVWLTLDPGINIGVAVWTDTQTEPLYFSSFPPNRGVKMDGDVQTYCYKCISALEKFESYIANSSLHPEKLYVEWPAFFSRVTAQRGDLVKLTFALGWLAKFATAQGAEFVPLEIVKWKGQLPKEIVQKRIRKILTPKWCEKSGLELATEHAWDAVGMGLAVKGLL